MVIVKQAADEVAANGGGIFRVIVKGLKAVAIKTIQSIECSKPQKPIVVLENALDRIIR